MIVLSPWAVRNLSFDERISGRHGYDVDICLQARAAGKRVVTADLRVIHHHSLELLEDPEALDPDAHGRSPTSGRRSSIRARRTRTGAPAPGAPRPRRPPTGCGWAPPSCSETTPGASCVETWRSSSWIWTAPLRRLLRPARICVAEVAGGRALAWSASDPGLGEPDPVPLGRVLRLRRSSIDVDVAAGERDLEQRHEVAAGDVGVPALLDRGQPLGERKGGRVRVRQQPADQPVSGRRSPRRTISSIRCRF